MKESFIFYRSFYEALTGMSKEKQADCLMAIANYALNGEEPTLTPEVRLFFTLVKPQIDANNQRFLNGKKGGRPKKTETKPNKNQNETKTEPNVNVNDNVNVNVNDNVNKKKKEQKEKLNLYGEFKHVHLTEEYYEHLKSTFGEEKLSRAIEKLDGWLDNPKQKSKRNCNHRFYFKSDGWVWEIDKVPKSGGIGEWDKTPETYTVGDY